MDKILFAEMKEAVKEIARLKRHGIPDGSEVANKPDWQEEPARIPPTLRPPPHDRGSLALGRPKRRLRPSKVKILLAEMRAECQQMEEAIASLERLALGGKRRGRPPFSPNNPNPPLPPAAAMRVPRRRNGLVWAVAGRKRLQAS
jgi:hypothetical protein